MSLFAFILACFAGLLFAVDAVVAKSLTALAGFILTVAVVVALATTGGTLVHL